MCVHSHTFFFMKHVLKDWPSFIIKVSMGELAVISIIAGISHVIKLAWIVTMHINAVFPLLAGTNEVKLAYFILLGWLKVMVELAVLSLQSWPKYILKYRYIVAFLSVYQLQKHISKTTYLSKILSHFIFYKTHLSK